MKFDKRFTACSIWLACALLSLAVPFATMSAAQELPAQSEQANGFTFLALLNETSENLEFDKVFNSATRAIEVLPSGLASYALIELECETIAAAFQSDILRPSAGNTKALEVCNSLSSGL